MDPQTGLPTAEELAEYYVGEPETLNDVVRVLLEHEAVRGFTFGAAGVVIAVLMAALHICLMRAPRQILPEAYIPTIINFGSIATGVLLSMHPLVDVSHGVHMGVQAVALYNLAHHKTKNPGDMSSVIRPPKGATR